MGVKSFLVPNMILFSSFVKKVDVDCIIMEKSNKVMKKREAQKNENVK